MMIKTLLPLALALPAILSPLTVQAQSVPISVGINYGVARQRLIQAGWKPVVSPRPAAKWIPNDSGTPYSNMDQQITLTEYFRKKGWQESLHCAPTGLGLCDHQFFGPSGRGLIVITTMGHQSKPPVVEQYKFGDGTR